MTCEQPSSLTKHTSLRASRKTKPSSPVQNRFRYAVLRRWARCSSVQSSVACYHSVVEAPSLSSSLIAPALSPFALNYLIRSLTLASHDRVTMHHCPEVELRRTRLSLAFHTLGLQDITCSEVPERRDYNSENYISANLLD